MDEDELVGLVATARDEDAAMADLEECLRRVHCARVAKTALAALPAEQLRTALQRRRADLSSGLFAVPLAPLVPLAVTSPVSSATGLDVTTGQA